MAYIRDDVSTFSAIFICKNIITERDRAAVYRALVGLSIVWIENMALQGEQVSKNSLVKLHVSALRRFMLRSPIM